MQHRSVRTIASILTALALASTTATPAQAAGSISNVRIVSVTITSAGSWAWVTFASDIGGTRPTASPCSNVHARRFAFDPRTNEGKAMLTLASSAVLSGKRVLASGTNTCTLSNGHENLSSLTLQET